MLFDKRLKKDFGNREFSVFTLFFMFTLILRHHNKEQSKEIVNMLKAALVCAMTIAENLCLHGSERWLRVSFVRRYDGYWEVAIKGIDVVVV